MNQPVLSLWEVIGGVPVPIPVIDWSPIDRGQQSAEKIVRIYNNKGGTGCSPAKDCLFIITDPGGGDSLEIIQGNAENGNLPYLKAKALSICYSAENDLVCAAGNGSTATWDMHRGANDAYVADSAIVRQEFYFGTGANNASAQAGGFLIVLTDPNIDSDNPISKLPATIVLDSGGGAETYITEGYVVDYSGGNIVITLDSGAIGQGAAFTNTTAFPIGGGGETEARYTKTLTPITDFSITSGPSVDPAQVVLVTPPALNCRVWMDFVHRMADTIWHDCGGSSYKVSIGGDTVVLNGAGSGLDNITPVIPDGGYAEIALKIVIPSTAQTGSNVASKPSVFYNWAA